MFICTNARVSFLGRIDIGLAAEVMKEDLESINLVAGRQVIVVTRRRNLRNLKDPSQKATNILCTFIYSMQFFLFVAFIIPTINYFVKKNCNQGIRVLSFFFTMTSFFIQKTKKKE